MGAINKNSARQRIIRLEVNDSASFPIARHDYIQSMQYRIAKQYQRTHVCTTTGKQIKVTRTK